MTATAAKNELREQIQSKSTAALKVMFLSLANKNLDEAGVMVRVWIADELVERNPRMKAAVEAWVDDLESDKTYDDVVMEYINA